MGNNLEKFKKIEELRHKKLIDMNAEEKRLVKEYIDFIIEKRQEERKDDQVIKIVNDHHDKIVENEKRLEAQRAIRAERERLEKGVSFDDLPENMTLGDWFRWINSLGMHYNKEDYNAFMNYFIDGDEELIKQYFNSLKENKTKPKR